MHSLSVFDWGDDDIQQAMTACKDIHRRFILLIMALEGGVDLSHQELFNLVQNEVERVTGAQLSLANFNKHLKHLERANYVQKTGKSRNAPYTLTDKGSNVTNLLSQFIEVLAKPSHPHIEYIDLLEIERLKPSEKDHLIDFFEKREYTIQKMFDELVLQPTVLYLNSIYTSNLIQPFFRIFFGEKMTTIRIIINLYLQTSQEDQELVQSLRDLQTSSKTFFILKTIQQHFLLDLIGAIRSSKIEIDSYELEQKLLGFWTSSLPVSRIRLCPL